MVEPVKEEKVNDYAESGVIVDASKIHLGDDDIAAKYASDHGKTVPPDIRKRILWKSQILIGITLGACYGVQFLSHTVQSQLNALGMTDDLNMENEFPWLATGFFIAYLAFAPLAAYICQKLPVAFATSVAFVVSGIVFTCSAASQSFAGMMACRVILGTVECIMVPSLTALVAMWFPKELHYSSSMLWMVFDGFVPACSCLVAAGLVQRGDSMSISPWRALLIIDGLIMVLFGIFFYFHVPNTPHEAWFLTSEEKRWHVELIRENQAGYGNRHFKWYQVKETFIDPRTYLNFATFALWAVPNGLVTSMQSFYLKSFGITKPVETMYWGALCSACEFFGMLIAAILSTFMFTKYRIVYNLWGAVWSLISLCMVSYAPNYHGNFAGICLWYAFSVYTFAAIASNVQSNCNGHTKKMLNASFLVISQSVGNAGGPQAFKASEKPDYVTSKRTMVGTAVCTLALIIIQLLLNVWENRRRDKSGKTLPPDLNHPEFADLTDMENPNFRYAY